MVDIFVGPSWALLGAGTKGPKSGCELKLFIFGNWKFLFKV